MSEAAIAAVELTRRFGSLTAVDSLSFSVAPAEIFGLVGPDGAGKSTTLRMLAGILEPSAGSASVAGFDCARQSDQLSDHIAYMSQQFGLYTDLTVIENIEFYADLYGVARRGRAERIEELLGFSYMQPFRRRLAGNLSGGMKQKLQLICALIHTPQVLLLDEPTNGVDPVSRRDFWRILYQLQRRGVTIFLSTAYLDEAERCARLALLHEGRLLALGTPSEVKRLMRGEILELRSSQSRRIAALLEGKLEALSIGLFGDRVHVVTQDAVNTRARAEQLIRDAGLPLDEIRLAGASLEDVFVSVLAQQPESGDD